jgi:hypothetical protein
MTASVSRFVLRSLRAWRTLRRSVIIFWPTGDSSDDDAGDGADENGAHPRDGVIGRRDFGFLEESALKLVSQWHSIEEKEENTRMPAFPTSLRMFSLLPLADFKPFTRAILVASNPISL